MMDLFSKIYFENYIFPPSLSAFIFEKCFKNGQYFKNISQTHGMHSTSTLNYVKVMFGSEKCEKKKIERKIGRKEKIKKMKINFFTCLVIHRKFKGKKNYFILFG